MENEDIREFDNALISIRGNSLRYRNSVFAVNNIVSLTFDSVRRERDRPGDIEDYAGYAKWWLRYFFITVVFILVLGALEEMDVLSFSTMVTWTIGTIDIDANAIESVIGFFLLSVMAALPISLFTWIVSKFKNWRYETQRYYYVKGLRIIFTNNMILYFVGGDSSDFIEETLRGIESFIAEPLGTRKKEMTINFSNNSINIDEVKNSNVVGGNITGGIHDG